MMLPDISNLDLTDPYLAEPDLLTPDLAEPPNLTESTPSLKPKKRRGLGGVNPNAIIGLSTLNPSTGLLTYRGGTIDPSIKRFSIKNVIVEDGVVELEGGKPGAFGKLTAMKSIAIASSCVNIGKWQFAGCHTLKTVNLPSTCLSIANNAFHNCNSLVTLLIPDGCVIHGKSEEVFYGCKALRVLAEREGEGVSVEECCRGLWRRAKNEKENIGESEIV